jgi:hypothetical protein
MFTPSPNEASESIAIERGDTMIDDRVETSLLNEKGGRVIKSPD